MAKRVILFLTVIATTISMAACTDNESVVPVDISIRKEVSVRLDPEAITYAYLPQFSHSVSFQRHHPMIRYLSEATGRKFRQVFPDTFDEHMRMVGQGKIDISFSNPFVYVKMANRSGSVAFSRVVEKNGREFFRGEIICRADNPRIHDLNDLRGLSWIAVDQGSAGGYLFPMGMFLKNGIVPEEFSDIAFAPGPGGKQEKVVLAVHAGQFDIGTIREGAISVVADKINPEDIRVVARTPWYPGWVFSARKGMASGIVNEVRDALIALDPSTPSERSILEAAQVQRIIPATDGDFESVRDLWKTIRTRVDDSDSPDGDQW
ncbi:MAG: phosphate/phosphite/phosphonate ABC transporter substrate-binding protein [Desulfobacterales bacterium]